jgi:flagellar hook-basal body complex protein FliE
MDIKGIDQLLSQLQPATDKAAPAAEAGANSFSSLLSASIDQVNASQQSAAGMAKDFAAGTSNASLHEVMAELQKANLSFQTMVQVRNKLVTAYQDIMNMQV